MPAAWYQEAVFYELYLRAFCDSNGDGHGDLRGALSKLDYLQSLGVNCLWLLPHYPSPLQDDGYDVADYYGVHPDYGTLADFRALVAGAHARGMRVVTDLVLNHTSDQHPWFQAARRDRQSPYHHYYVWSDTGAEYSGIRRVFPDFESSNWTFDAAAGRYYWHRFFRSQPDLNFDNPAVAEEMWRIVRHWLDLGVDGFRLDAVIYLYEREGTDGAGLPETHAFIRQLRHLLESEYPDRILIAEANDWPQRLMAYFGADDECHLCFNFPLMPRLYLALLQADRKPLVDIINATPAPPPRAQWLNFLRNHDELTLEMVTPEEGAALYAAYAPDPRMRINNGIRRRLGPLVGHDQRCWRLLKALLLALPGAPILYYGDEIGLSDNIALPDRYGCRTPMQWDASPNAGFTSAATPFLPVNADYAAVNVAAQAADPDSYLNWTRRLIHARQASPALRRGALTWLEGAPPAVVAFRRQTADESVLCVANLSDQPQAHGFGRIRAHDKLGQTWDPVWLPPYAAYWLEEA